MRGFLDHFRRNVLERIGARGCSWCWSGRDRGVTKDYLHFLRGQAIRAGWLWAGIVGPHSCLLSRRWVAHISIRGGVKFGMPRLSSRTALPFRELLAAAERRDSWGGEFRTSQSPLEKMGDPRKKHSLLGVITVASAPDSQNFVVRFSRRDHGGLHRLVYWRRSRFEGLMESPASACPSLHLGMYRGTYLLLNEAK